ncbi:MAG TPA: energy-coupling factor ABC transporter permease [Acidimicrobiales bacterium]|nr:energy-coupling factor ABC transporter permease [Acidimicrobiales bacterium]
MHIPDGFVDAPTSVAATAVSAGGLAVCLRRSAEVLEDRLAPLAGLVAAYVFAVQMLNFPVAGGTSGHLLGGALAAVLVGPWVGALCVSVVLVVQALLFADGGISAIGLNVLNMALVGAFAGYGLFVLARRVLPATRAGVAAASGVAALLSVVLASLAFALEYALGGTGGASVDRVTTAMVGVHVLIGIGEALITAMTVSAVIAVRPDLVHGATDLVPRPTPAPVAAKAGA